MGKTAFTLTMARNIAINSKIPVAFFSLEMSAIQLITRLIASETGITSDKLRTGKLTEDDFERLNFKIQDLLEAPLYIDDTPSLSIFDLRAKARRMVSKYGVKIIFIDYLQLMTANTTNKGVGNREQEISTISRNLKALAKELDIPVYRSPQEFICCGKHFLIGHGDGLGPGDKGYKRMKKVFTNPFCKWLFRWLHPDIGVRLAQYLSVKNKLISGDEDVHFLGQDKEWLVQYCRRKLQSKHYDYFLFGHRHLPMTIDLGGEATYINTGDWIHYYTYAVFDGEICQLISEKS